MYSRKALFAWAVVLVALCCVYVGTEKAYADQEYAAMVDPLFSR